MAELSEPEDTDLCWCCEHPWSEHAEDVEDSWKIGCECCKRGEFYGEPVAVDDMSPEMMEAWKNRNG